MTSHDEDGNDTAALAPLRSADPLSAEPLSEEPLSEEPLCGEEEFAEEVRELVDSSVPRLFALVQEQGERLDAWVMAWGLEFEDGRVQIVRADRGLGGVFDSVAGVLRRYSRSRKIRLVWTTSAIAGQPQDQAGSPNEAR